MAKVKGGSPLESVIQKGCLEKVAKVAGDEILLHIATVKEEQEVNKATVDAPLLDREYERWIQRLSWTVTRVNDHIFEDQKEALEFFRAISQPHLEAYVKAYADVFREVNKNLGVLVEEVKNS